MGEFGEYKPAMGMLGLQFIYAAVSLITKAAMLRGMSPRVFIVYRQAVATLALAPAAYFLRRKSSTSSLGLRSFSLIFLASLIGVTISQNIYFEGLLLASASMASAMGNLIPAITFVIAAIVGLEKVRIRSSRSIAKIVGTVVCVSGAIFMALLKGPKLLKAEILLAKSIFGLAGDQWLLGCLLLFGSTCCWSMWLILQVPMSASYPDHLSLTAWMCFFATIQSGALTLIIEPDPDAWVLHSTFELLCCLFAGTIGSGVTFFVQGWCISQRGPLFSAMFSPLCTVIVTILAALFWHEEVYMGSLIGAAGVIMGLYAVLWGKAEDVCDKIHEETNPNPENDATVKILIDQSLEKTSCKLDLEVPLLSNKSADTK